MSGASLLPPNEAAVRSEPKLQALPATYRHLPRLGPVGLEGLSEASDREIWEYARKNAFALVSLDSDFAELAALRGSPPKVIWLRCGNQSTAIVEEVLRSHEGAIVAFEASESAACLEVYRVADHSLTKPQLEP